MSKKEDQQEIYDKLVSDFAESRTHAGIYLLKMAETIAEAKHNLSRKIFKRFLKDPKIKVQRLQANKMIAVYHLAKSDSRLTHFINKEGIEKSYLITTIEDEKAREKFSEEIIDIPFTVKQTKQAIQKIISENKNPIEAIEEVKNKIVAPKAKEAKKTVPLSEYEKLKTENEQLRLKLAKFEKNQTNEKIAKVVKLEQKQIQEPVQDMSLFTQEQETDLAFLN